MSVTFVERSLLRQTVSGGATLDIVLTALIENYDAARDELEVVSGLDSTWMSFSATGTEKGILKLTLVPLFTESRDFELQLRARRSGGDSVTTSYLLTVQPLTLLPPNATEFERTLEASLLWRMLRLFQGANVDSRDMTVPAKYAWDPDKIPSALLPYLAYSFSVDVWSDTWSDATKREMIRKSYLFHSEKGTLKSVRDALDDIGETDAVIVEPKDVLYNRSWVAEGHVSWAHVSILMNKVITIQEGSIIADTVDAFAPVRSVLQGVFFSKHSLNPLDRYLSYDGEINYNDNVPLGDYFNYDGTVDYDSAHTYDNVYQNYHFYGKVVHTSDVHLNYDRAFNYENVYSYGSVLGTYSYR